MSTLDRMLQVLRNREVGQRADPVALAPRQAGRSRRPRGPMARRPATCGQTERLEDRLAMAINIFPAGGELGSPWAVIASDGGDDVYVQQVATAAQNLLVADNASFNNASQIVGINGLTTLYATNGTAVSVAGIAPVEVGTGTVTTHLLSNVVALTNGAANSTVSGSVSYAGNRWNFTNGGGGNGLAFTLVNTGTLSDPTIVFPTSGTILVPTGANAVNAIRIFWSAAPGAVPSAGITAPVVDSASYNTQPRISDFAANPAAGTRPTFALPATAANPGAIVPGTLNGSLRFGDGDVIRFRTDNLFTPIGGGPRDNVLFFENGGRTGSVTVNYTNSTAQTARTITFTGYVSYETGRVFLEFAADPGPLSLDARYAVYAQDARSSQFTVAAGQTISRDFYAQFLAPGSSININSPIVQAAGLGGVPGGVAGVTLDATNINLNAQVASANRFDVNFNTGVVVTADPIPFADLARARAVVGSGGRITAIGIPSGFGGQGYSADNPPLVTISGTGTGATARAVVTSGVVTAIVVDTQGSGYDGTTTVTIDPPDVAIAQLPETERLNFNAPVSASSYSLIIGDDPGTDTTLRGRMFVSPSGSLVGQGGGAANSLFVQADTSDLAVEGTINATNQTYLMQSPNAAQSLAPFTFSTVSPLTGANVGLIQGTTVAITLGNDLATPEQSSVAANVLNLRTKIGSLRVTAATRVGDPLSGPFPYELTIDEVDAIAFDAVAASSRAISLSAGGGLSFNSAIATAGDLSIRSGAALAIAAPLSTSRGQIGITGTSLAITNSISVLAPVVDARDDVTLTATAGDINVAGAISGVNGIRLVQRNKAGTVGKVSGGTRLVARTASIESEGSVAVRTDVVTLTGRAAGDFSVDELNDIAIPALSASGLVTLRAGGVDPGVGSPFSPNVIALEAALQDVTAIDVSAPRGSIDVTTDTAKTLVVGNVAAVSAGTASSMLAAGSVRIRSVAGPVVVADAPIGAGSAMTVRFARTDDLPGTYNPGVPGLVAATLTGDRSALQVDGTPVGFGDRILLANQADPSENGIYTVTVSGSVGRNWVLTRSADADTSAELAAGTVVRVLEGLQADAVYRLAYEQAYGTSPVTVNLVPNRAGAEAVRVATTSTLPGAYDAVNATISGAGTLPLVEGVSLAAGDRLLVRFGTIDQPPGGSGSALIPVSIANGVYEVESVGAAGGTWVLRRATNVDTGVALETGYVTTTEGAYRAAVTGQAFAVAYDSLGADPLTVTRLAADEIRTDIGTEDVNDTTTFVVSSAAGTNAAAGSLGKMIGLRQAVSTDSTLNPTPTIDFAFATSLPGAGGAAAGVIRLSEELPAISRAFAIDGANRFRLPGGALGATAGVSIDGSRILTTRTGRPAATASSVNGFEFVNGSQSAVGSAGGSVANLTVGGFGNGAAVKINGVDGILVSKMVLGRDATGGRLADRFGVLATGPGAGGTVSGSTIVGSTQAGIRTEAAAAGLAIVGTTVGVVNQGNGTGIELSAGTSYVGIDAAPAKQTIQTVQNGTVIVLPPGIGPGSVFLGQGVSGPGIASGTTIAAINGRAVTLSKPMTATAVTQGVNFAAPVRNTVQSNLNGLVLSGGVSTVINTNVFGNAYDGVQVTGGTHSIGTSTKVVGTSNAISGNGRYGVNVAGAIDVIVGNSFGGQGRNVLGNVIVNGVLGGPAVVPGRAGRRYEPNAKTRLDSRGNFHALSAGAAPSGGSSGGASAAPSSGRKFNWR